MKEGKIFFILGALLGFLAVAAGAFGGHALRDTLTPEMTRIFEIGVRYQMYHALALFAVCWAVGHFKHNWVRLGGWLFYFLTTP